MTAMERAHERRLKDAWTGVAINRVYGARSLAIVGQLARSVVLIVLAGMRAPLLDRARCEAPAEGSNEDLASTVL
jgi:hypothetical protein